MGIPKGFKHTKESKAKMSLAMTGKTHTELTKAKLRIVNTGKKLLPETIAKIVKLHKGSKRSPETRARISAAMKGKRPSASNTESVIAAIGNGHLNKLYKHPTYTAKNGQTITFRSSWEYEVAKYLDWLGVVWEYELEVLVLDGEYYLPDFFIFNAFGQPVKLIEVKGYFPKEQQAKMKRFQQALPIPLEIWDRSKLECIGLIAKC